MAVLCLSYKNMKKRILVPVFFAAALTLGTACSTQRNNTYNTNTFHISRAETEDTEAPETETLETESEETVEPEEPVKPEEPAEPEKTPYEKAVDTLLSAEGKALTGPYEATQDFFDYVREQCGEETVLALADAVVPGAEEGDEGEPFDAAEKGNAGSSAIFDLTGRSIHVWWTEYLRDRGTGPEALSCVFWKDTASGEEIVMDFTGDINFMDGCGCMNYIEKNGGIEAGFSENLLEELRAADLCMMNNEFAYSTRGAPLPGKSYTFRADPKKTEYLFALGTDIVGLANNHIFDYGEEALLDTLDTLDAVGMPHVGAGRDLADASRPVYFIMNGRKIAFTAATQIERSANYTRAATEDSSGVLKTLDPAHYCEVLREAKANADFVVAFVHWGTEGKFEYEGDQAELARQFAEAGADVIIGGHTHCLQGIAYVEDVPVIYSVGNFWFSSTPSDGWRSKDMGIAQVRLQRDGSVVFRFLPCHQESWRTVLYSEGPEKERILALEQSLSTGITLDEDGYVIDGEGKL